MELAETLPADKPAFTIAAEAVADIAAREALLDRAMGPGRKKKSSEKLRRGRRPSVGLAFVARDPAGAIVGTVRLWDVRLGENGPKALLLGPLAVDSPEHAGQPPQPATGYARPHELDLGRADTGGGLWARVTDLNTTGAVVKVELTDDEGRLIQVQLGRDAYTELLPTAGERLAVTVKRVRVFLKDEKP